jgi:peptide subunit release factor RF-3
MMQTRDVDGRLVALFSSEHELNYYSDKFPEIQFNTIQ